MYGYKRKDKKNFNIQFAKFLKQSTVNDLLGNDSINDIRAGYWKNSFGTKHKALLVIFEKRGFAASHKLLLWNISF